MKLLHDLRRRLAVNWPLLLLALALIVQFHVYYAEPEQFLRMDARNGVNHIAYVANHLAVTGVFPLWNPYAGGGEPYFLTSAWLGHFNVNTVLIAAAAAAFPQSRFADHYLWCLWGASYLILLGCYAFFRECGARPGRAFVGTLPFLLINAHVSHMPANLVHASLLLGWFFWCFLRWRKTGAGHYWYAGTAVVCLMLNGINYAVGEALLALGLFLVMAWFLAPRAPRLRPEFPAGRVLLTAVLVLLVLSPRLLALREVAGGVKRIGRAATAGADASLPALLPLPAAALVEWSHPILGLNEDVPYPNLFLVFLPWAAFSRRHRWLLTVTLVFALLNLFGFRMIAGWLGRHISSFANISLWFFPPFCAMYLLGIAAAVCGLERYVRRLPEHLAVRPAGNWIRRGGWLVLAGAIAGATVMARPDDGDGQWARLVLLMLFLLTVAAVVFRAGPLVMSRGTASRWFTVMLAIPALFLVRALPTQPAESYRDAGVTAYRPPVARTCPAGWEIEDDNCEPQPAMLEQRPTAEDVLWRMRDYDTILHALSPAARCRVLCGPLFFLDAQPREIPGTGMAIAALNGDTFAAGFADLLPRRDRHYLASATGSGIVIPAGFSPGAAELEVQIDTPMLLVNVDRDFPGWQATCDGEPAPIVRVNAVAKGVWLAAGRHRVVFTFAKPWFQLALWMSLCTAPFACGLAVLNYATAVRRARREGREA